MVKITWSNLGRFDSVLACDIQTDGQTNEKTDNQTVANTGLCIAATYAGAL